MLMSLIPDVTVLVNWITTYGSVVLFILMSLGILALPVPEETLMVIAGILMRKGILQIPPTVLFAYAGAMCGITMSYVVGRTAGNFLILRYGKWVGITDVALNHAHRWFEKLGKWLLIVGYFIPGVRHLTGLIAGTTYMKYSHFALYAYTGAFLWVSLFLSLGYFVGSYCLECYEQLGKADVVIVLLAIISAIILFFYIKWHYKRYNNRKK